MKVPRQAAAVARKAVAPSVPFTPRAPTPAAVAPSINCNPPQFYWCACAPGKYRCCVTPDFGGNGCSDGGVANNPCECL
jgi:hypothetical protein